MTSRHTLALIALLASLLLSTSAFALDLNDIKEMASVGVPDNIIVSTIANSEEVFNLSADQIVELKKAGISDAVIEALQATSGSVTRSEPTREDDEPRVRDRSGDDDRRRSDVRSQDDDRRSRDDEPRSRRSDDDDDDDEPRSRRRSEEGEDDTILRRRRSRDDSDSDSRSSRKKTVKRTPKEVKDALATYKEKKYLTASLKLYRLLEGGKYPEHEPKLNYYLGASLKQLGLLHSAQVYFQRVVREGPDTGSLFTSGLSKMVEISDATKDPIYLIREIDRISPEDYPGKVKDDLYYYQGVRDFEREDYSRAKRNFMKLGKSSDHYIQARYQMGVIYNAQERKKKAFKTFYDVIRGDYRGDPETIASVKQLSYMNMARIRYGVEQYSKAAELYEELPRMSEHWGTSLYEAAWAHFMAENKEYKALGHLLTIDSPFFEQNWLPDARILEALTYYRICEYKEVEALLDQFKARYVPVQETINDMLQPYTDGDKPLRALYESLYGVKSKDYRKLPVAVFARLEGNRNFAGPHNRVLQIERELQRVKTLKSTWRDSEVGKSTKELLEKERKIYMKIAGIALANELGRVRDQLGDLLGQEALIRFEVTSGEYQKYQDRFRNPDATEVDEGVEFDFATNPDVIYWPFNQEFWEDELGFYERVEPGDCKE